MKYGLRETTYSLKKANTVNEHKIKPPLNIALMQYKNNWKHYIIFMKMQIILGHLTHLSIIWTFFLESHRVILRVSTNWRLCWKISASLTWRHIMML